jgi:WD40 repeat protein
MPGVPAAFSPDGRLLATANTQLRVGVWEGDFEGSWRALGAHEDNVTWLAFSPDGRLLASTGHDRRLRLWDLAGGEPRALGGHGDWVTRAAFAPDGRTVATLGADKTVRLWDVATGASRALRSSSPAPTTWVAYARRGDAVAVAGPDGKICLYPDDLPHEPAALAAWLDAATGVTVEAYPGR